MLEQCARKLPETTGDHLLKVEGYLFGTISGLQEEIILKIWKLRNGFGIDIITKCGWEDWTAQQLGLSWVQIPTVV